MNRRLQDFQDKIGRFYIPLVALLVTLVIGLLGYSHVKPKTYHFELNQVADQTILAPATIEDQDQTAINKERARDSINDIYLYQEDVRDQVLKSVDQFFSHLKDIRSQSYSLKQIQEMAQEHAMNWPKDLAPIEADERKAEDAVNFMALTASEQEVIFKLAMDRQGAAMKDLAQALNPSSIEHLLSMNDEDLQATQEKLTEDLAASLEQEVSPVEVEEELDRLRSKLTASDLSYASQQLFLNFFDHFIQPTLIYSETETNRLKDEAEAQVQPSYILQGQVIVQKGHIINRNNLRQLNLYGYLDTTKRQNLMAVFIAIIGVHGLLMVLIFSNQFKWDDLKASNFEMTAYSLVIVGGLLLLKITQMLKGPQMAYAALMVPMMIVPILLKPKAKTTISLLAVIALNLLSLFFISDHDNQTVVLFVGLFYWLTQAISLMLVLWPKWMPKTHPRLLMVQVVIQSALAIVLMVVLNIKVWSSQGLMILTMVLIANLLGILLLAIVTPYWEQLLSDKAPMTLNQLANLNHPLLKLLIEKAPGTYHHSIMVANLAANAVEVIGGDSLMTRVAAYYHDIGKTVHPLFFVENLSGGIESPHRMVKPEESAAIIIDHVTQGVRILNDYHMPQSIIDVCQQHHGTTLVAYFYHQAKQDKANIKEEDFRYLGPIPQSKEIAVMMIADSLEAASRTMKEHSQEAIEQLVDAIIQGKIDDGQFAQSGLTVDELYQVRRSLISGIGSMYHTRIDYPK